MARVVSQVLTASRRTLLPCALSAPIIRSLPRVRMAHVPATNEKVCFVVGGNGALGQAVVETFRAKGWIVVSADKTYVETLSSHNLVATPAQ